MGSALCYGNKATTFNDPNKLFALHRFTDVDISNRKASLLVDSDLHKPLLFLEQALESIIPRIDLRCITKAKQNCHFPSEHGLTHDESAAIYLYTLKSNNCCVYEHLNHALQSDDPSHITQWLFYLTLLKSAFDKLPNVTQTIWRGVHDHIMMAKETDSEMMWCTMNSASTSFHVIQDFLGLNATLFSIDDVTGKNASGYTSSNLEEILLWPGTKIRIKEAPTLIFNGSHIVHLVGEPNIRHSIPYIEKPYKRNSTKLSIKRATSLLLTPKCSSVISIRSVPLKVSHEKHFICPFPGLKYSLVL